MISRRSARRSCVALIALSTLTLIGGLTLVACGGSGDANVIPNLPPLPPPPLPPPTPPPPTGKWDASSWDQVSWG
jgi:hypothetical protein